MIRIIATTLALMTAGVIASGVYGLTLAEREHSFTHTVAAGDTVWDIADRNYPKQTYLSFNEFYFMVCQSVKAQNGGDVVLQPGQVLVIKYKDKL